MSELENWIWLSRLRCLRTRTRSTLLAQFSGAAEIRRAERKTLERIEGITSVEVEALLSRDDGKVARILRRCEEENVQILTIQDALYPERLRNIPDPPFVLYVRGRLPAVDAEPVIAVVGTRRNTPYGEKMARNIAYELAAKGAIVCTGLADGIDSLAAKGALTAGGKVIGVLGLAINKVYPRKNDILYQDVEASGALISEYPPDVEIGRDGFPQRNRIIAGLSLGTVVVEAPLGSGACITAARALDYGRDVFAVPGNADAKNSQGCNGLLREGAILAENGWDVLKEYEARFPNQIRRDVSGVIPEEYALPEEPAAPPPEKGELLKKFFKFRVPGKKADAKPEAPAAVLASQLDGLTEDQLKLVSVMTRPAMHVDDIIDLSRLPAATVLSELTMLQIKGYVTGEQGKRFTLNIKK